MKAEVKEQEVFKPITLTITIESEEELCNLWHRMNAQIDLFNGDAKRYYNSDYLKHKVSRDLQNLWDELDGLIIYRNLKNKRK
jgi:hypothetical protein